MWIGILIIAGIALAAGALLNWAASHSPDAGNELEDAVNALLPQTQCAQCGYPGCRPYARAVVAGEADINLCPPGGDTTLRQMAALLGREAAPLISQPPAQSIVAEIDESACIGCFHCRDACPVDAIVGAHQLMHTVIASECTGCELCVAPCPVDCISMRPTA